MENAHKRERLLEAEIKIQVAQKTRQEAALDLDGKVKRHRKGWQAQIKEEVAVWAMGTGTVQRLLRHGEGGQGISAGSRALFMPRVQRGGGWGE